MMEVIMKTDDDDDDNNNNNKYDTMKRIKPTKCTD
jgi:hypothetical protein